MIENNILKEVKKEFENSTKIKMSLDEAREIIFMDGKQTQTMHQTLNTLYSALQISEQLPLEYSLDQAFEYWINAFICFKETEKLYQYNIIIYNCDDHNSNWINNDNASSENNKYSKCDVIELYKRICKYCENEIILRPNGRRISIDFFMYEENLDEDIFMEGTRKISYFESWEKK